METLVIVQIAVQFALGAGGITHVILFGIWIFAVILVALVVASRVGPVRLPVSHANPTELKTALLTSHVIAS